MPILTDDMKRVVHEQGLGFVATVCPDGTPNLSPKGTTSVWDDDHLVFADLFSPGTMSNLRRIPRSRSTSSIRSPERDTGSRAAAEVHADGPMFEEIMAFYERERQLARSRVRSFAMIDVATRGPTVSPAYDTGLSTEEVVARSLRRLEQIYGLSIERTGDEGIDEPVNPPH